MSVISPTHGDESHDVHHVDDNFPHKKEFLEEKLKNLFNDTTRSEPEMSTNPDFDMAAFHPAFHPTLLSLACLLLAATLVCLRGVLRPIFALKAAFMTLSLLVHLLMGLGLFAALPLPGFHAVPLHDEGNWLHQRTEMDSNNDSSYNDSHLTTETWENAELDFESGWLVDEWLSEFCFGAIVGLNVIFFHELYLCFCEMRIRKFEWLAFGKKIAAIFCVIFLVQGFQIMMVKLIEMGWDNSAPLSFQIVTPFLLITFTGITVADTYLVVRILMAFAENCRFRSRGGGNAGRQNTGMGYIGLIMVVYLSHFATFAVFLTAKVWNTVNMVDFWRCLSEMDLEVGFLNLADDDCEVYMPGALIYLHPFYFYFFEFAFLFSQVLLKHYRKRSAQAARH